MSTKTLVSQTQIQARIKQLAKDLAAEYRGKNVILVGVLKGAFMFLSDLTRALYQAGLTDAEVDFLGISSYGKDTESSKNPRITHDLTTDIRHRHVLLVEDIVDTGYSLDALTRLLAERNPTSLKSVVLLSKQSRRQVKVAVDYIGFKVEGWVEGYGLDTAEKHRGRPEVVVNQPE
jgi:hypoxanthine phosphoribosyltransferase